METINELLRKKEIFKFCEDLGFKIGRSVREYEDYFYVMDPPTKKKVFYVSLKTKDLIIELSNHSHLQFEKELILNKLNELWYKIN